MSSDKWDAKPWEIRVGPPLYEEPWNEDFRFCGRCGERLITVESHHSFDRVTGEEVVAVNVRCPRYNMSKLGYWVHDDFRLPYKRYPYANK